MNPYITYRIIDPRDGAPFYVGQSINIEKRKKQHIKRACGKLPKRTSFSIQVYLVLLKKEGFDPIFEEVDAQPTEDKSLESEKKWVAITVNAGFPVLNRWKEHSRLVRAQFSKTDVKEYFYRRFPNHKPEDMNNPYRSK